MSAAFEVHLENFTGPFDLLLSLITKRELDVTEVALSVVTDEFVAYTRALPNLNLDTASEFLVIAATLLDLKAARLLPGIVEEDAEDLELLEARDLLFARLLQYRAYKQVAGQFAQMLAETALRTPRLVPLEPWQAALLPELQWSLSAEAFAEMAARALTPKAPETVSLSHLHAPKVSVREQLALVSSRLRRSGTLTFRALVAGETRLIAVARFLALLELFRAGSVTFEQAAALSELTVRWSGDAEAERADDDAALAAQIDEFEGGQP